MTAFRYIIDCAVEIVAEDARAVWPAVRIFFAALALVLVFVAAPMVLGMKFGVVGFFAPATIGGVALWGFSIVSRARRRHLLRIRTGGMCG